MRLEAGDGEIRAGSGASAQGGANGASRKTSLTGQEQVEEASRHISRMVSAGDTARKMLSDARKDRDVVKTVCLNDKVSQVDVAIRSAKERRSQLAEAVGRNDGELAGHQFTMLAVLRQRVEQVMAEAKQCIGEDAAFVGETSTRVTIDPSIAADETPYPTTELSLVIAPPPCTSCVL